MPSIPRKDIALGLKPQGTVAGPITQYDPKIAMRMLEAIASGATRKEIEADASLPSFATFVRWTLRDTALREAWEEARRISALLLEDRALEEARTLTSDAVNDWSGTRVRAAEVAMNQWRWSAARRDRQAFGDRSEASLVVPVQINTTLDLGNGTTRHVPQTDAVVDPFRVEFTPQPIPAFVGADADVQEVEWEPDDAPETPAPTPQRGTVPTPPDELSSPFAAPAPKGRPRKRTGGSNRRLTTKNTSAAKRPRKSRVEETLK